MKLVFLTIGMRIFGKALSVLPRINFCNAGFRSNFKSLNNNFAKKPHEIKLVRGLLVIAFFNLIFASSVYAKSYPIVPLTSSTNQSLKVTIQADVYKGTSWTYKVAWNRTAKTRVENGQTVTRTGSLRFSPYSDRNTVLNASTNTVTINPDGETTIDLKPCTKYRVEFYASPNNQGTLLLRKFFTTRNTNGSVNCGINNPALITGYNCQNNACIIAAPGQYSTLESCQAACKPISDPGIKVGMYFQDSWTAKSMRPGNIYQKNNLCNPENSNPHAACGYEFDNWQFVKNAAPRETSFYYHWHEGEINKLKADGFYESGRKINFPISSVSGVIPVYAMSKVGISGFYFAVSEPERAEKKEQGFEDKGVIAHIFPAKKTPPQGTLPLYRINWYDNVWQLTTSLDIARDAITSGWIPRQEQNQCPDYSLALKGATIGYVYANPRGDTASFSELQKKLSGQMTLPRIPKLSTTTAGNIVFPQSNDTGVMRQYIDWMADSGVNFIAFNWWYSPAGDSACPDRLLWNDEAINTFMKSPNASRLNFVPAWFPLVYEENKLYPYDIKTFKDGIDYALKNYVSHPSYLKINGKPAFYLATWQTYWNLGRNAALLKEVVDYGKSKGFYMVGISVPFSSQIDEFKAFTQAGFDAITDYSYLTQMEKDLGFSQAQGGQFKQGKILPYDSLVSVYGSYWETLSSLLRPYTVNFIPVATAGWDRSQVSWIKYYSQILVNNTPDKWQDQLRRVKIFVLNNAGSNPKIVMLHSWNEWFEGTVIEPDNINGDRYLQAVKNVFGQ